MAGVQINKGQLADVRRMLSGIKNGAARAEARALNRVASKAKTRGGKDIRKDVRLPAAYVRDRLNLKKATFSNLQSAVVTPSRGLLLSYFLSGKGNAARYVKGLGTIAVSVGDYQQRRNVSVKVKPTGRAKKMPNAFILPRLKYSGVPGVAIRKNGKLDVLHGPSLSQVFTDVKEKMAPDMADELAAELDREASYLLSKNG